MLLKQVERSGLPIKKYQLNQGGNVANTLTGVLRQAIAKIKKHWIISSLAVLIGIYAFLTRDRSVSWEEEVLLNTGADHLGQTHRGLQPAGWGWQSAGC